MRTLTVLRDSRPNGLQRSGRPGLPERQSLCLPPRLYLKGIPTGDLSEALAAPPGPGAEGLSLSTVNRLKDDDGRTTGSGTGAVRRTGGTSTSGRTASTSRRTWTVIASACR